MTPSRARYREVAGRLATGVTVITAVGPAGPVGMTANAVCSLSLEPLLLLACFDNTARTLPVVRGSGRFGVNVLAAGQAELAALFASKGQEGEKFAAVGHDLHDGVPVLHGALAWISCELQELLPRGDHTIAIGAVREVGHGEAEPLLWYRGLYGLAHT